MSGHLMRAVRETIYGAIVRTGSAPRAEEIASIMGISRDQARDAMRTLADAHVIVLDSGTERIRFAAPFAGMETRFRVRADGGSWFAPCAWDAFGIPAALHGDAEIATCCAHSGELLVCGVRGGESVGRGVVHMLVPAARFWENIVYT